MKRMKMVVALVATAIGALCLADVEPTYSSDLKQKAEAGDAAAQLDLALCYDRGSGIEKDAVKAHRWFLKAAEQGNGRAMSAVGNYYANGEGGVDKDLAEAVRWYRKSVELGNDRGQCNLGVCYEIGRGVDKDLTEAVKWYRKSAEQGNAAAQCNLGACYENGRGVDKDMAEAVKWYRKSAEQGNAAGQRSLGVCYEIGRGVDKDMAEAVKWYRKSAEQGDAAGQRSLGVCYECGRGVDKDMAEAVKWYRKSAEQGDATAQCKLGLRYAIGLGGVDKDMAEAVKWYRKSAEQGNQYAQFLLGKCYFFGNGVDKDLTEAVKWYRKSAEQGNQYAQYGLGCCYHSGDGVDKDLTEAVKWFRKSAEQGNAVAQFNLGVCYANGYGVKEDIEEAFKWVSKAAKQGDADAKKALESPAFRFVGAFANADDLEEGEECLKKLKGFSKKGSFKSEFLSNGETLSIEGLQIGMPVDEAVVACKRIAQRSDDYVVIDSRMLQDAEWSKFKTLKKKIGDKEGVSILTCRNTFTGVTANRIQDTVLLCTVKPDRNGVVDQIRFTEDGINVLFKAANLTSDEFAAKLQQDYRGIGLLRKNVSQRSLNGTNMREYRWTSESQSGCRVELYENAMLILHGGQMNEIKLKEYDAIMANDPNAFGAAIGRAFLDRYLSISRMK